MGVKWTPEQESAIIAPKDSSLDNQTLLVARVPVQVRPRFL